MQDEQFTDKKSEKILKDITELLLTRGNVYDQKTG
jgi:hypothetical protein